MPSTLRFLRQFLRPDPGRVLAEETRYRRGDETLEATLYRPTGSSRPLPGWVTLHGLTYHGRNHPSLQRFASALAASGAAVLVPDLPEWRQLAVAPGPTVETIKAAVLELDGRGITQPGRIGVMGFSFGGTQALIASTDPALEDHLAGVASWGGYGDIRRVARFMFSGEHELDGERYHRDPDPYGRWILAGDYLTLLPEHADDRGVADAVKTLALEAGRRRVMSWSPEMDAEKARQRERLDERQRATFDLLAPPAAEPSTRDRVERLAQLAGRVAEAALEHEPLLDPQPFLPRVRVPVFLAHGREDRLIPWTEMIRLRRGLPEERVDYSGITSLFSHSFGAKRVPSPGLVLEGLRFLRLLRSMVRLI